LSNLKRRIIGGIGANASGQLVTIGVQLVSLPLFLRYWSMAQYGEWLLLSAVPGYFSLADGGMVAVAMNKMTMLSARGDGPKSSEVFQTALALIASVVLVALTIAATVIGIMAFSVRRPDGLWALFLLIAVALANIFAGLFDAVFRASGQFAYGVHLLNLGRLMEWGGGMIGLVLAGSMIGVAGGFLLARLVFTGVMVHYCARRFPAFRWHVGGATRRELKSLLGPAAMFLAFPLGNALSFQGMTLLVGGMFGPVLLAVFNTYRTVSRILVQLLATISRSLWPEVSRSFGGENLSLLRRLYRSGTKAAAYVCGGTCLVLLVLGRWLIERWSGGRVPYYRGLFVSFLVVAFASCFWQVGMVVLQATNNHRRLAVAYVLASLLSLALGALLAKPMGLAGAVVALGLFEVAMIVVSRRLVDSLLTQSI